jgi:hypothetical protein
LAFADGVRADGDTMSDIPQSPEAVAYRLLQDVIAIERAAASPQDAQAPTRKWLLETYGECLRAVKADGKAAPTHGRSSF